LKIYVSASTPGGISLNSGVSYK